MLDGRIAVLTGPETVEIKTFPVPDPEPGAVVLAVRRANVCGSDVHQWHYESAALREAGLGHEFIGTVVALGEGVTTDFAGQPVEVGDRVVPVYFLTCLRCPACLRSEFNLCQNGLRSWAVPPDVAPHFRSAFATHYYVQPGQYFYKVPRDVDDAAAAGANCGLAQVIFVLDKMALKPGDSLVIQGAGGLGLYASAVANERGIRTIVIDGVPERLELALRFGATDVVSLNDRPQLEDRVAAVMELTGGAGADAVLEVTGIAPAFAEAVALARAGGTIASVGNLNAEAMIDIAPGIITRKSLQICGVLRYDPWYLHKAIQFLHRRGGFHPFDALSARSYPLDEVASALHAGEARSVARVAIEP